MTAPRKADEALAQALGISTAAAAKVRGRLGSGEGYQELDAGLRAEAALSDLDAARSIGEGDVADAVESDDPMGALEETLESRSERSLAARLAAHESWGRTTDRAARTAKARAALDQKFLDEAGGDPVRAEHLRKAHYLRMALKSAQARRARRDGGGRP